MRATSLDLLNEALKSAEQRLYTLNLGITAKVCLRDMDADTDAIFLTWDRDDRQEWGLFIDGNGGFVRLLQATAALRVEAAEEMGHLAQLLDDMASADEKRIRLAISTVDGCFTGSMSGKRVVT